MAHSIVEFFPEKSISKCGYCKQEDTSTTIGMWLHSVTADDMMSLTNRNWRRSGKYSYHPDMRQTCCPQYMIKCDAINFRMNKKQRQAIYKMNRYLKTGDTKSTVGSDSLALGSTSLQRGDNSASKRDIKPGEGADPTKPKCMKAKERRQLKRMEKLYMDSNEQQRQTEITNSNTDNLQALLDEAKSTDNINKLELCLVRSEDLSGSAFSEEFAVYKAYQVNIHGDCPADVSQTQFRRFLVDSPIECERNNGLTFGSFHLQYKLNGKIIAVEVIDILPEVVSSVYLFYDPHYGHLSLGKYSALVSMQRVRELNKRFPRLRYYLMGFYIHSCHKMRYKGDYDKSFLICPETYEWVPIEICRPKLDAHKYSRLTEDPDKVDADLPIGAAMKEALEKCHCLYNQNVIPYRFLCEPAGPQLPYEWQEALRGRGRTHIKRTDGKEVESYITLVGCKLSQSLLLYRQ